MDFRLEFEPASIDRKLDLDDNIMLIGSCFTDHMYNYFVASKFHALQNPNGVLFNPVSIAQTLMRYIDNRHVEEAELFDRNGLWNHWDFHSKLSCTNAHETFDLMNRQITGAHHFLKNTQWLILTLGSAFVYELEGKQIVANCHKLPSSSFEKRMLGPEEIVALFNQVIRMLKSFNPGINIMLTVSPVRHLRDGFVENNRSKAVLIHAVDSILQSNNDLCYFPSYELIIDDLRDYRFYAEDMVHPNYLATRYVWEKFCIACVNGKTREVMKELEQLRNAVQHKALHPDSAEHKKFLNKFKTITQSLSQRFPRMDLEAEIEHFR